ncbi:MAG: NAD(+)/NADH kinase [archaeon]
MKTLVVCKHPEGAIESDSCRLIEKHFSPIYAWKNNLEKKDLKDIDLVIALGGDGTVLSASHYLTEKPLLAVNSSPTKSEGALTTLSVANLGTKLNAIKNGKFKTEKLERIEVFINDKPLDILSLNEVFIANEKAYLISKYKISFKSKEEEQRSSGLIFSTGTGSTAWFKSAKGTPFAADSKFIKMITREPYKGKLGKFSLTEATINEGEEFHVYPLCNSVLAIDSIHEFKVKEGDKITLRISSHPLLRII